MKITKLLIFASIISSCIAFVISLVYVFLLLANIWSDSILMSMLFLYGLGFLCSLFSLLAIFMTRTCWICIVPILCCIIFAGAVLWGYGEMDRDFRMRAKVLEEISVARHLLRLREALVEYADGHSGLLPAADKWCDELMEYNHSLVKSNFKHPAFSADSNIVKESNQWLAEFIRKDPNRAEELIEVPIPNGECNYAFNSNLSGRRLSEISPDTILLFEANGNWNLSGTHDVLNSRYSDHGFITVVYMNGTTADYWFDKKAIRRFDKGGKIMYYVSPKWEP